MYKIFQNLLLITKGGKNFKLHITMRCEALAKQVVCYSKSIFYFLKDISATTVYVLLYIDQTTCKACIKGLQQQSR